MPAVRMRTVLPFLSTKILVWSFPPVASIPRLKSGHAIPVGRINGSAIAGPAPSMSATRVVAGQRVITATLVLATGNMAYTF